MKFFSQKEKNFSHNQGKTDHFWYSPNLSPTGTCQNDDSWILHVLPLVSGKLTAKACPPWET